MRGEIDCKAPGLQLLRHKAMQRLQSWPKHEFLQMIREWNQSADLLASPALQRDTSTIVASNSEMQDLISPNGLDELIVPERPDRVVKIDAITRSALQRRRSPEVLREEGVQQIRIERIKQAQEEGGWIANVNYYLVGNMTQMNDDDAKMSSRIAPYYAVAENGLLFLRPDRQGHRKIAQR